MAGVFGLPLIAVGTFHVWARNGVSDAYNAMFPRSVVPILRYTPLGRPPL
jgi:hypothetical protein